MGSREGHMSKREGGQVEAQLSIHGLPKTKTS